MPFLQNCVTVDGKQYCWDEDTASVVQVDFTINRLGKNTPEEAIKAVIKNRYGDLSNVEVHLR